MDEWIDITQDAEDFASTPKTVFDTPAASHRLNSKPQIDCTPIVMRTTSPSHHRHDIVCLLLVRIKADVQPISMYITGDAPEFGHWDLEHSLTMCRIEKTDVWAVQVTLSPSIASNVPKTLTYKCMASWGLGNDVWEAGPNRLLNIPSRTENWSLFSSPRWADELPPCIIANEFRVFLKILKLF